MLSTRTVAIPDEVELSFVGARQIKVKGPRGELVRDFRHLQVDMQLLDAARATREDGLGQLLRQPCGSQPLAPPGLIKQGALECQLK